MTAAGVPNLDFVGREVWRAANQLIALHSEHAPLYAMQSVINRSSAATSEMLRNGAWFGRPPKSRFGERFLRNTPVTDMSHDIRWRCDGDRERQNP